METKEKVDSWSMPKEKTFWSRVRNFFRTVWEPTPVILMSALVIALILLLLDMAGIINLPFDLFKS